MNFSRASGLPEGRASEPDMITIRFAGWICCRIVSFQTDKDIQKLLSNGNRIWIRISETLLSLFRGFRLLEKVAHCTLIHLLSSEASFQPSAPWLRVCPRCKFWTVELCQVCQHEMLLVWQDRALFQCTLKGRCLLCTSTKAS